MWAAVLAGGSGTRFWPLSTPERPKQLLPLAGDRPLLVQAVERLEGLVPPERVVVVTGPLLVDAVAQLVPQVPRAQVFGEPRAASTAAALVWAAHWIAERDPGAQMVSLHADWAVEDDRAFRAAARQALGVAAEYDVLVTVGVKPTRPETGYGYNLPGAPLGGGSVASSRSRRRRVRRCCAAAAPCGTPGSSPGARRGSWARPVRTRASSRRGGPPSRRATCPGSSPPCAPSPWTWRCSSARAASPS